MCSRTPGFAANLIERSPIVSIESMPVPMAGKPAALDARGTRPRAEQPVSDMIDAVQHGLCVVAVAKVLHKMLELSPVYPV